MGDWEYPFAQTSPWVHSLEHGIIYGWTGNPAFLPDGFVVCDGNNGTPDLRDRFVPGALNVYSVGEKNGVSVHVHNFTSDGHRHNVAQAGTDVLDLPNRGDDTSNVAATGTTDPKSNLPRYFALVFLMKL